MKKLSTLLLCILLAGSSFAQSKIYVSLGAGIGFGTASTYKLYQPSNKVYPVALGKAVGVNLHAGYFLNDYMAIDLGVAYKIGLSSKIEPPINSDISLATGDALTLKYSGSMLQLVPGIVFMPALEGNLKPYTRIGVIIGVMNSITTKFDSKSSGTEMIATLKYSGGVAVGGSLALGADFALSDLLSLYAGADFTNIYYAENLPAGDYKLIGFYHVYSDYSLFDQFQKPVADKIARYAPFENLPYQVKQLIPLKEPVSVALVADKVMTFGSYAVKFKWKGGPGGTTDDRYKVIEEETSITLADSRSNVVLRYIKTWATSAWKLWNAKNQISTP